jgi:rod shape determining protein RodA
VKQHDAKTLAREGFHLRQSLIAIGSGGLVGKGIGEGTQNTLGHLREKDTDFIYGVIAEESGFIGSTAIVILFLLLIRGIAMAGLASREPFGRLVAAGIAAGIAAQAFENIGMTMGLTPITGVPLPFVSLGGSSLLASWLAVGLACQIASRKVRVVASRDLEPAARTGPAVLLQERSSALLESRWPVS